MRGKERDVDVEGTQLKKIGHLYSRCDCIILYIYTVYRFCIDIRMSLKRSRNLSPVLQVSCRDKHRCICILLTNELPSTLHRFVQREFSPRIKR